MSEQSRFPSALPHYAVDLLMASKHVLLGFTNGIEELREAVIAFESNMPVMNGDIQVLEEYQPPGTIQ